MQSYFRTANARPLDEWWDGMPGADESFRHFYERISGGLEAMLEDGHATLVLPATHGAGSHRLWQLPETAERILVAAHEGTNAVLLSHLLGVERVPFAWARFSSAWAGISTIQTRAVAGGAIWSLESFNTTHHLAPLAARSEQSGGSA